MIVGARGGTTLRIQMRGRTAGIVLASVTAVLASACGGGDAGPVAADRAAPPQKIIIDSDFNTMADDGQVGVMAAQLQAAGTLQVMGITVVSGNAWLGQGVADAVKAVERLGVGERIGVYVGAERALDHDLATIRREQAAGAGGDAYLGAWTTPEPPSEADLVPPPDGFASRTAVQPTAAVDFIVDTVKANPGEITVLAIGPLTNIALATRRNPEIVPLIKQIVHMGGAVDVPGNATATAEFNWWFDPDAARAVVRLPIPQVVVPLDVTNTVVLTKPIYDRVAHPATPTAVTTIYQQLNGLGFDGTNGFENNPDYTQNIWDGLALAYVADPSLATVSVERYIDVVAAPGAADNGRSVGYAGQPPGMSLQRASVVKEFDDTRFFELYSDLLTRPVPVHLPG